MKKIPQAEATFHSWGLCGRAIRRCRGYEIYVGKLDNTEIDFIATKQENKLYIQAAQEIGAPETEKCKYGRLLDIRDNYPKYILRADAFAGGNYEGIKTMHIADFLLSDEY